MIKLNDTGLAVGEIKLLLATFNLPNCPIGEKNKEPNKHYIEGNQIYLYYMDAQGEYKTEQIFPYIYGLDYHNLTRNLRIDSMAYDRYTHRYLGKYLRFIRDYKGVDLMAMYNCFDGELFTSELKFTDINGAEKEFRSNDINYIIYQIPITLSKYTLALQSKMATDMYVTIVNPSTNTSESILKNLAKLTYRKYKFNKLIYLDDLFTRYVDHPEYGTEWESCVNLMKGQSAKVRLCLRVPKTITSSITLLEGLYSNKVDSTIEGQIIPTRPLLLSYQNNVSYLLSDKMLEYLTGNAITPLSEDYDIKKLQDYISKYFNYPQVRGVWNKYTTDAVKSIIKNNKLWLDNYDMVPYCDKSVEKNLKEGLV